MDTNTPRPEVGQIYTRTGGDPFEEASGVVAQLRDNGQGQTWVKYDFIVNGKNLGPQTSSLAAFLARYTLKS